MAPGFGADAADMLATDGVMSADAPQSRRASGITPERVRTARDGSNRIWKASRMGTGAGDSDVDMPPYVRRARQDRNTSVLRKGAIMDRLVEGG